MSVSITWHGHSNFQIAAEGINILIDPFFTGNSKAITKWNQITPPDLVLITHDHGDHMGDAVAICKATGAACGCVVGTGQKLLSAGIPSKQILNGIGFHIGGAMTVKGATIRMTQAFHSSDTGVPVGYVITLPSGFTLYHSGDTGIFDSMRLIGELWPLDVAMLPIGNVFTMDSFEAAHAVRLLGAKRVISMHWATFPMLEQDTTEFEKQVHHLAPNTEVLSMQPGQTITL